MSGDAPEAPPPVEVVASGTLSLLDIFKPVADLQIEARLHERVGLAAHLGYGRTRGLGTLTWGAQARAYVKGGFAGGTFGAVDVNWLRVEASPDVAWDGNSTTIGPVVGLKHVFEPGFTIEGHFGYGALLADGGLVSGYFLSRVGIGWSL